VAKSASEPIKNEQIFTGASNFAEKHPADTIQVTLSARSNDGRSRNLREDYAVGLRLRCRSGSARIRRLVEIGSGRIAGLINLDRALKVRAVFDHDAGGS
jgi:hypothetical protein